MRSTAPSVAASLRCTQVGAAEVALERPEFGIATGQACVFYRGSRVLGGGWIATTGSEFINV